MASTTVQQTRINAAVREAEQAQDKVEKAQRTLAKFTQTRDTAVKRASWLEGMPVDDPDTVVEDKHNIKERLEVLRARIAGTYVAPEEAPEADADADADGEAVEPDEDEAPEDEDDDPEA